MLLPVWAELRKVNYRVTVNRKYTKTIKDMEELRNDLNDLLKNHKDWGDAYAEVEFDEVECCKLCGETYIPDYDEDKKIEICRSCSGGKFEYALKILKEGHR